MECPASVVMALHRSSGSEDRSSSGNISEPPSSTDAPVFYNPDEDSPDLWSHDSSSGSLGSRRQGGGRRYSVVMPPTIIRAMSDCGVNPSVALQDPRGRRNRVYAFPNGCEVPQRPAESSSFETRIHRNSTGSFRSEALPNGRRRRRSRASLYGLPDDCIIGMKLVSTSSGRSEMPATGPMRRGSRASLYGLPDGSEVNSKLVDVSQSELGSRRCSISSTGSEGVPKSRERRMSRASLYGLCDGEEIAPVIPVNEEWEDIDTEEGEMLGYKAERIIYRPARRRVDSWSDNDECNLNITHEGRRPNDKDSDYEDDLRDYRKGSRFRDEI